MRYNEVSKLISFLLSIKKPSTSLILPFTRFCLVVANENVKFPSLLHHKQGSKNTFRCFIFISATLPWQKKSTWKQVELENWVNSIHSACAAAFARHRGKTGWRTVKFLVSHQILIKASFPGTLHLLQEEIFRIDKAIESVRNMKTIFRLLLLSSQGLSGARKLLKISFLKRD